MVGVYEKPLSMAAKMALAKIKKEDRDTARKVGSLLTSLVDAVHKGRDVVSLNGLASMPENKAVKARKERLAKVEAKR